MPVKKIEVPKVVNLSMGEFEDIKWEEFAAKLKGERILPPSYEKKPAKVKVTLSKTGNPMAIVEFRSTTSDSYRVLMVLENEVYESINSPAAWLKNNSMTEIWKLFRDDVKYRNKFNQRLESYGFVQQRKNLEKELKNLSKLDDLFDREVEFLDKYKDCRFASFGEYFDENYLPTFVIDQGDEVDLDIEMVTPFTPKTLEFCVSKLTQKAKEDEASFIGDFVEKCEEIQTASIYKTGKWNKTITRLVDVLRELNPQKATGSLGSEKEDDAVQIDEDSPKSKE